MKTLITVLVVVVPGALIVWAAYKVHTMVRTPSTSTPASPSEECPHGCGDTYHQDHCPLLRAYLDRRD